MIVDTHCHIHFPELIKDLSAIIERMQVNDVQRAITICTDLKEVDDLRKIVDKYDNVFASIGVHPNTEQSAICELSELLQLAKSHDKFIAIGECGLDYHYEGNSVKSWQLPRFETQIEVAIETSLPLVVHTRDSIDDTIDVLTDGMKRGLQAVLHCYTGDWAQAQKALDIGCMISFTGIVTFKSAKNLLEIATNMPTDRLMVETDAPYLAPTPFRGKVNEPSYVLHTLECIAKARGKMTRELMQITTDNANRFFKLPS